MESPPVSKTWLVDGFCWYGRKMVRKRFGSFGVNNVRVLTGIPEKTNVVVYLNHAGWWDPIVGMLLRQWAMPQRTLYAPIDAEQLENYAVLKKMGFFGVQMHSFHGALSFLATSKVILSKPNSSLWLTPEGRFCDARDTSQPLMPGLSHLASKLQGTVFIPLAIEYPFWDEALPHILCRVGWPIDNASGQIQSKQQWHEQLTLGLRNAQEELAELVLRRNPTPFDYLIESTPQRLSWYDYARSWSARLRGRKFDPRHGKG